MQVVIDTMLPLLAIVGLGFLIEGRTRISMESLSQLALLVCSPCLIFAELARDHGAARGGLTIVGATLFIMLATGAGAALVLRLRGRSARGLILPVTFWNAGNLGLSACRLARGEEGFEAAALVFVTVATAQALLSGLIVGGQASLGRVLRMPIVHAAALGILCSLSGLAVPRLVMEPIGILGEAAIPLLLVVLGQQLRRLRIARPAPALFVCAMRQGVGLAAALLFVTVFSVRGVLRDVLLIESIMPPAILSLMFAQRFDAQPEDVASAIVAGSLLSLLLLPLVLILL
ncbi:MAG: AEC family transporter [Planctomycetes bacterium]|nr:AEC family transporter [Planctomycetota bacterium]